MSLHSKSSLHLNQKARENALKLSKIYNNSNLNLTMNYKS